MRNILSTLIISLMITTSSLAAERNIEKSVKFLSDLAMGYDVDIIEGKNAEEIMKNFVEINSVEDSAVFKEYEDMTQGDEIDEGFTSVKSAIKMSEFAEAMLEEQIEYADEDEVSQARVMKIKAQIYDLNHNWAPIIKSLERQGVKFGYSGSGPGYCGVSFIKMLIIDEKEQKVYQVYLSEGGSC
ncbi:MAG: hypothetical protein K2Q18_01130 [Bdellovibrionales bacterium]|nr:hypothetical protein [Bdellovibrionales bacterium]